MKLLQLKTIDILHKTFTIEWDKNEYGGWFSMDDGGDKIGIGTKSLKSSPESVYDTLLHELSEVVHVLMNTRYEDYGGTGFKFFMDHKQFQTHNYLISKLFLKFFK